MMNLKPTAQTGHPQRSAISIAFAALAMLSGCANYSGISSDRHIEHIAGNQVAQSLPEQHGHWPAPDWASQFGDPQLDALIKEALQKNPSVDQAKARLDAAAAYTESAQANTQAKVDAGYKVNREQYSANSWAPHPLGGSWQTENNAMLTASYDLDMWGKNDEIVRSSVSKLKVNEAALQEVKLALSAAIARKYNELARLYVQQDLVSEQLSQFEQMRSLSINRVHAGLDNEIEQRNVDLNIAGGRVSINAIDGRIVEVRYQLAALLGAAPDRGLQIDRPSLGTGRQTQLPDNLPADLLSRRPDIVMARWQVDATTHDIKAAKSDFYPNINLSAALGLDAFGFGRFLNRSSDASGAGPAIHLPIFDGGALRAQLTNKYADYDYAVASYNQTLIAALSDVATQVARIRATDAQLMDAQRAADAATKSWQLMNSQYKAGLNTLSGVIQAHIKAIAEQQSVTNLQMNRRDQQISLAQALGGGFVDDSGAIGSAMSQPAGLAVPVTATAN